MATASDRRPAAPGDGNAPTPALAPYPPIVGPADYPFAALPQRWRGPLEVLVAVVAWFVLAGVVFGVLLAVAEVAGVREDADGFADPHLDLAFGMLAIAVMLPAIWLALRLPGRRTFGSVSSVAGRMRWAWLRRCLWPAAGCTGVSFLALLALDPTFDPDLVPGAAAYLGLAAIVLVVVPFQAAAEEYVTRGWLWQALVPWLRRPWLAALPGCGLFVALHGSADPERIADLTVFALVLCWLTLRTGGLEAAVAYHAVTNVLLLLVGSSQGLPDLDEDQSMSLVEAAATVVPTLLYAAWIDRRWRREVPPEPVGHPPRAARAGAPATTPVAAGAR